MRRPISIAEAIRALIADSDRLLAARPRSWNQSGEALILHHGDLHRLLWNEPDSLREPPHRLLASEIVSGWDVVSRVDVLAETGSVTEESRSRRGRPTVASVRKTLSEEERLEWHGVLEAAHECGVPRDVIRRAIRAQELPVRRIRGATLVRLGDVRGLRPSARQDNGEVRPVDPVVSPAPDAEIEEVYQ